MLEHVGKFTETLHKIHTFVEAQQDSNKIKQFFRQNQMSTLLKDCRAGLQLALDDFAIKSQVTLALRLNNFGSWFFHVPNFEQVPDKLSIPVTFTFNATDLLWP
ncbi:hypothetical protein MSAN_01364500 [Mycena sanguinolenta]|uniref:Uncharacterized protein n=1 Tax=Mycena sanguinolenta TaxID=230812 RepID=A0A8H7D042_9AGAR|nr:hypothetical protein MSAN_01364500 [Mycena sanguinolenta]